MKTQFYLFIFLLPFTVVSKIVFSEYGRFASHTTQEVWKKKADLPASSRNFAVSFSIGNKGYYGMGQKQIEAFSHKVYNDFWEYDPAQNTWTQKAEFPNGGRLNAKGFALNGKGYVGFGYFIMASGPNIGGNDYQNDLYAFDPVQNTWIKKNTHYLANEDICFVLQDTAWSVNPEYRTVKKYDHITDTWTEKSWGKKAVAPAFKDMIGRGIPFSVQGSQYIITTIRVKRTYVNKLWAFNPYAVTWTQKGDIPFTGSEKLCAFGVGAKGCIMRNDNDFLEYDPLSDSWTKKETIHPDKEFSPSFTLEGKVYGFSKYKFWECTL